MQLNDYFKNGTVYIWNETFAIIKAAKPLDGAFTTIIDKDETTVIIDQTKISENDGIEIEKDWKVFTLDIVFPMDVCGVTAKIATALAEANISIMPLAAFSRDHFLIKEKDAEKAKTIFTNLGITLSDPPTT